MSNHVFYVVATEGDLSRDVFGNAKGDPIIFETALDHATLDEARRRATSLSKRYGKAVILECKLFENYVEPM